MNFLEFGKQQEYDKCKALNSFHNKKNVKVCFRHIEFVKQFMMAISKKGNISWCNRQYSIVFKVINSSNSPRDTYNKL